MSTPGQAQIVTKSKIIALDKKVIFKIVNVSGHLLTLRLLFSPFEHRRRQFFLKQLLTLKVQKAYLLNLVDFVILNLADVFAPLDVE